MSLIRRPFNGPPSSPLAGLGLPVPLAAAPGTVLHTLDGTGAGLGGPFPQRVTMFVQNASNGALTATITAGDGSSLVKSLAAGETWQPFDSQPMLRSGLAAPSNAITGEGSAAGLVAWGFIETQT